MAKADVGGTRQEEAQEVMASGGELEPLVIRAPVHCDGCGRKLRRSVRRIEGVEEVTVDSRTNTVVVRGRRAKESATEVVQVVERRTGGKAVLVSPSPEKLPPPRSSAPKGGETNKKGNAIANTEDDANMEMVTVLKMNMHCDACSEEIKRRILKITGVEEAVAHLKSSQVMVKGKVEPATLVGFIHKCTGRKAAIIRAEPLDDLLPRSAKSPAPPLVEAESKKDEPLSENSPGEEKNNGRQNGRKDEEPNEENKGGGGQEEDHVDESPEMEKPRLENHTKDDRLLTVPMPAGVVTVAPEMALFNRSYCYPAYPSYGQYYYPYQPYPAYASCSPAAMYGYGYGYPANYPPEAFSEENSNGCTIM